MAEYSKLFEENDAELIALAVQDVNGAKTTLAAIQKKIPDASLPILADPVANVAKEWKVFGLKYIPAGGPDDYAYPSVFIINRERTITWQYVGKHKDDRPATYLITRNLP